MDAIISFLTVTQSGAVLSVVALGLIGVVWMLVGTIWRLASEAWSLITGLYGQYKGTCTIEFHKGWEPVLSVIRKILDVFVIIILSQVLYRFYLIFIS